MITSALLLAGLLLGVSAGERPTVEVRPFYPIPAPSAVLPDGVVESVAGTTVDPSGTAHGPDGSKSCVPASPCAYAADGRAWGEPAVDIDPVWAELEQMGEDQ